MKFIAVQLSPWEEIVYLAWPEKVQSSHLKLGQAVVISNDNVLEIGNIIAIRDEADNIFEHDSIKLATFIRCAIDDDLTKLSQVNQYNDKYRRWCHDLAVQEQLGMKIVACRINFDDSRAIFAFMADGRVDFRDLVKQLSRRLNKQIRLYQLGVRDEARWGGDCGSCGRPLCCRAWLQELGNVSTEFAKDQQVAHRGSERLSGVCGRLKCCLAFEQSFYKKQLYKFPILGSQVKTKYGAGKVISLNLLSDTYDVHIEDKKGGDHIIHMSVH